MKKKVPTRSTKHETKLKHKLWFRVSLIGTLLALIVCLGLFIHNQNNPVLTKESDNVEKSATKKRT